MLEKTDRDMIDGLCCSRCAIYFEREHGYPVLCEDCFELDEGISKMPVATIEEA